jgi:RNA polymerase sigma factor (sigma-70 family)
MTFEEFVLENYGKVVRSVALAFGDRPLAEDAVQEAFVKAYRSWRRVSLMDRPDSWVYVVACNAARRAHRKAGNGFGPAGPAGELDDPIDPLVSALDLEQALGQLTARQRAAVVLRYLADLPIEDIARALDCAQGTVKATLHQSLRRLRVEMEDKEDTRGH